MASLRTKKTKTGTTYIVCFRFGDRLHNRSLGEVTASEAEARRKRVEATIYDINIGRLTVPPDGDAGLFILSDGKLAEKQKAAMQDEPVTLKRLWEQYRAELPEGAKERSSQKTEALHVKHLLKVLGESTPVTALTVMNLQGYITRRSRQKGFRGKVKDTVVNNFPIPGLSVDLPEPEDRPRGGGDGPVFQRSRAEDEAVRRLALREGSPPLRRRRGAQTWPRRH